MFWWEQPERAAELIREHALAAPERPRRPLQLLPTSLQPAGSSLPLTLKT